MLVCRPIGTCTGASEPTIRETQCTNNGNRNLYVIKEWFRGEKSPAIRKWQPERNKHSACVEIFSSLDLKCE
jgi:hypothetical protein